MHKRDHPENHGLFFIVTYQQIDLEIQNMSPRVKIYYVTFTDHLSLDLLYRDKGWEHSMGHL